MSHLTTAACIAIATMTGAIATTTVQAQTNVVPEPVLVSVVVQVTDDSPAIEAFGKTSAVGETDLDKVTGREDIAAMVASATQRNTVSNNSVTGTSSTGNVQIVGNAFQNLQGLAVISANSGNNVAINAAMNVTVNLAPR